MLICRKVRPLERTYGYKLKSTYGKHVFISTHLSVVYVLLTPPWWCCLDSTAGKEKAEQSFVLFLMEWEVLRFAFFSFTNNLPYFSVTFPVIRTLTFTYFSTGKEWQRKGSSKKSGKVNQLSLSCYPACLYKDKLERHFERASEIA